MENRLAKIISILLHPLLIPTYALIVLFSINLLFVFQLNMIVRFSLLGIVFFFTFILPVSSVLVLKKLKFAGSILLESRRERTFPLVLTIFSYLALFYLLSELHVTNIFLYLIYGAIVALIAGLIINLFWKISLHMLGWGAFTASFIGISIKMIVDIHWFIAAIIILSGLVGYARLKSGSHSSSQVYTGYLLGIVLITIMTFAI
jgi:hypothetical protein